MVGRSELVSVFRHHTAESQVMKEPFDFNSAKVLVAIYAVECGFKSLLLKQCRMQATNELESKYITHDLNILSQACCRKKLFPEQMTLLSKHHIAIEALHQALRYGLRLHDDSKKSIIRAIRIAINYIEESL
ncbi:MAG TPA: hypothetical protein PK156_36800 [Polyangium sp.]|nr:hypothetical protein [Polyangium sp.]